MGFIGTITESVARIMRQHRNVGDGPMRSLIGVTETIVSTMAIEICFVSREGDTLEVLPTVPRNVTSLAGGTSSCI